MVRIVHMADTHLGFNAFQKTAPDGSNFRECIIEENFVEAATVIADASPDIVLHAGDLFHTVKPKTRSILAAIKFIDTLTDNRIKFVCISGNHSMPKNLYTSSVFKILKKAHPEILTANSYKYEHECVNSVNLHLIPNMLCTEDYLKASRDARCYNKANQYASKDPHVLVTHGLALGALDCRLSSIAEFELTEEVIDETCYDYQALGHVHKRKQIGRNVYYSGSQEHLTYGEASDLKGALIVDIDDGNVKVTPLELPKAPMFDIPAIDCSDLPASDLPSMIEEKMKVTGGKCDQMYRFSLDFGESRLLPVPEGALKELRKNVMDLQIISKNITTERITVEQSTTTPINYVDGFGKFVSTQYKIPESLRPRVSALGMETLKKVIANRSEVTE